MFYGKCEFLSVIETVVYKAKVLYDNKLVCEGSALPFVKGVSQQCPTATEVLPQGWALRSSKKSTWFSEAQQWYLESKFKVGQETGLKLDPVDVAHDRRYARNQQGTKLFTVDEFLTAQQILSYFSRRASKLRHSHSDNSESEQDEDVMAAEEELAQENVCTVVLDEVALRHPIVF